MLGSRRQSSASPRRRGTEGLHLALSQDQLACRALELDAVAATVGPGALSVVGSSCRTSSNEEERVPGNPSSALSSENNPVTFARIARVLSRSAI